MASGDDDNSSSFFSDDLDRNDSERDLYAILHINKDVRNKTEKYFSCYLLFYLFRQIQQQFNKLIVD
jgi:hypothetical protein